MGIDLSFRIDGLSFLFAVLISGIGCLVQIYSLSYMKSKINKRSFHLYLTLFMLSMLGVVLSDNILLLFVFWELTTITSYLLIGFNHEDETSRKNALQAMLITGAGGLALLGGLIMLGEMAGSYQMSEILQQVETITEHSLFLPSMLLVLLGAFTKSAQFPFHFWLPGAMAAPTPVSAYLHSATMVKAGIYLMARLSPVYAASDVWFYLLVTAGSITAFWSALLALRQTDLKLMLANSTNMALGKLTVLLAFGTEYAVAAALLLIVAHAFYKASLFMVIGNVDKSTGTRQWHSLSGLKDPLKLSFVAAVLSAMSMAGLPPLLGFLSKEYLYKASLEVGIVPTAILLLANALIVAMTLLLMLKPFLGKKDEHSVAAKSIEHEKGLWLPPMLLAVGSFAVPVLALGYLQNAVIDPGSLAIFPQGTPKTVYIWQGVNLPLILSVVTLVLGVLIYRSHAVFLKVTGTLLRFLPQGNKVYQRGLNGLMAVANWQTGLLQHKHLSLYGLGFFTVLALLLLQPTLAVFGAVPVGVLSEIHETHFYEVALALLLVTSVAACLVARSSLLAVAALGMVGFISTLVFMLYSAPDVAKTQLLVEILVVVIVALLLRHLPSLTSVPSHSLSRRTVHAIVASVLGLAVTGILIAITHTPLDMTLSEFFAENSLPGGHGRNIVNVILVDFRAFDTLGEVVVVAMAAVACLGLFTTKNRAKNRIESIIFRSTAHIVAVLMLVFSVYLLMRGHNLPGGGFIGALIAVIGFALLMLAESAGYVRERLRYSPLKIAIFGVALALLAGAISFPLGLPFMTGLWWKEILPLGTPLLFDVGVYLAVFGAVLGILLRINEELD
ncbi:hydrogen gas-evolving membrane-bound hydrogenase subunit E [Thaumasiovibrio subtropicus]